jgi:solute carrier family 66 (lysosomal lysine-arginine transporter), member 1
MRLTSPANQAFLRESIPYVVSILHSRTVVHTRASYLLGSSGTLLFDVTIVCQSLIYRRGPPRRRGRRNSTRRMTVGEEEAALLSADALASHNEALARSKSRTSSL